MELFLSYSRKNGPGADAIDQFLCGLGVGVWRDVYEQAIGQDIHIKLERAILRCDAVLLCVSQAARESRYVNSELFFSYECGKSILPVMLESQVPCGWRFTLAGLERIALADLLTMTHDHLHAMIEQGLAMQNEASRDSDIADLIHTNATGALDELESNLAQYNHALGYLLEIGCRILTFHRDKLLSDIVRIRLFHLSASILSNFFRYCTKFEGFTATIVICDCRYEIL